MISQKSAQSLYKESGVDVKKSDKLVKWLTKQQKTGSQATKIGGFAAEYSLDFLKYKSPILVSSTDGVGTKLLLAIEEKNLSGIGQDLVAMCVNDLYTSGAKPLFFLDYFATAKLDPSQFQSILQGISQALLMCDCTLLGGETAEMPGLYQKNHFDLAGFVVGVVDKNRKIGAHLVKKSDLLYAFPSSGFHSNGYSLIRNFLEERQDLKNSSLITHLLKPTKIYTEIPKLLDQLPLNTIHAVAHITGGGILANVSRVIPSQYKINIDFKSLKIPLWMSDFLKNFTQDIFDFQSVFNLGCGAIVVVDQEKKVSFETICKQLNLHTYQVGELF